MMPPFGMHSSEFGSVALAAPKAACCWPDHLPWKMEGAGWSCADAVAASTSAMPTSVMARTPWRSMLHMTGSIAAT